MNPIFDFLSNLVAKLFGVALDQKKKPEPLPPVQIINVIKVNDHQGQHQVGQASPVINPTLAASTQSDPPTLPDKIPPIIASTHSSTTNESKPEEFTDEYFETLAIDLMKNARPQDRIILHDKRYPKEQK